MENEENFMKIINKCLIPKLTKNYDESESHAEFDTRNTQLEENIKLVIEQLDTYDFKKDDENTVENNNHKLAILSCLFIVFKELTCDSSWNSENSKECAKKIDDCFNNKCKIQLENIFKQNEICDSQEVFDKTLDELCKKLTSDDFKKYPGQVEVYCELVQNFKNFDVTLNPIKILPAALILMDDYIESNKTKGLLCCQSLLEKTVAKDFENGNYYDVIYMSVKNALNHSDIKIKELSQACALHLCQLFPSDVKDEKLDEMYSDALEQLNIESNLHKKAAIFKYTKNIMQMLQIKCVGKSLFKSVICDTIENCLMDVVAEILLIPCLECLEEWIKYCWPVWKLPVDFKVLCALLKYYSKGAVDEGGLYVLKLIVTLICLCSPEEQEQFIAKLECKDSTDMETSTIDSLKNDIGV